MNGKSIAILLSCLAIWSCLDREYENPFLSGGSLDREWRLDGDGDGIADSVDFYAAGCTATPAECLRRAQTASVEAGKQAVKPGLGDSSHISVPPKDTIVDTVIIVPPRDTVIIAPPRDTVIIAPPAVAVTGIQASAVFILMGAAAVTPAVYVLPRDARDQDFTLTSLDETVVRVSGFNLVPVTPGTAKVRARSHEGGFTIDFEAIVVSRDTIVREEKVTVASMEMTVGDPPRAPEIEWTPVNATRRGYSLISSRPAIAAIVSEAGVEKCRALAAGESIVTLKSAGEALSTTFKVTVKAAPIFILPVLLISAKDVDLEMGGPDQSPVVDYFPTALINKSYSLRSDKPGVVAVTASGTALHAVSGGKATITITSVDGPSGVFKVKVN